MNTNIVEIKVKNQSIIRTRPLYQWDSGQILKVIGQEIPDNTEVQFGSACMQPSVSALMANNQVKIPQAAMEQPMEITAYMVIVEPDSETTVKEIRIPIKPKPKPSDYVPEEDVPSIMQVIQGKADKGGWTPNKYLGTDAEGNMVEKDAPSGGDSGATAEQLEQIEINKQNIESLSKDFSGKADKATTLDGYGITDGATKSDVRQLSVEIANQQAQIDAKQPKGNYLTTETDPTVPAWAKAANKPTYTADEVGARPSTWTPSASEVGADPVGTAVGAVSSHNTAEDSHSDIRLLVAGLTTRLNALADSDDETLDQMSELVAYIKANRELIEQVTTGKVSVSDIVDNLTTNVANKPLSAAQGVALKALIDAITVPTKVSQLENDSGYLTEHQDLTPYAKTTDLTAHTGNSTVHVTAEEKAAWNGKSNFSGSYNDLSDKPTIPTVPTNVSAFTNDAGYLTEHQDISGKANTSDLTAHTRNNAIHTTEAERTKWNAKAEVLNLISDPSQTQVNFTPAEIVQAVADGKILMCLGVIFTLAGYSIDGGPSDYVTVISQYYNPSTIVSIRIASDKSYVSSSIEHVLYDDFISHVNSPAHITTSERTKWDAKEDKSNKVTNLSASSTDMQYPSAKCVYDMIGNVEVLLAAL